MDEVEKKMELLEWILVHSPDGAILEVIGFYSSNISKDSFERLFGKDNELLRNESMKFLIALNENTKASFLHVLRIEKSQLIHDLTHFSIRINDNLIATSYDNMELVNLSAAFLPRRDFDTADVEIIFQETIDDSFFT